MVSLFTRPRRFGKTLNMDMLRTFFEKTDEDTSVYFQDKLIWNQGEKYRKYQGKYPVIFITFKDVKKDTWDKTLNHIIQIITSEYKRHTELANSEKFLIKIIMIWSLPELPTRIYLILLCTCFQKCCTSIMVLRPW